MANLIKLDFPEKDCDEILSLNASRKDDLELEWDEDKGSIVGVSMCRSDWTRLAKAALGAAHLIDVGFYRPESEGEREDDIVWAQQMKRIAVKILSEVHGFDLLEAERQHAA